MSVTGAQAQSYSLTIPLPARAAGLAGDLTLPRAARGLVIFAHGSGQRSTAACSMPGSATSNVYVARPETLR